jgi:hypothetical protein
VKSIKKSNTLTYLNAENLSHEEIEEESKKNILEANKSNLEAYRKKPKELPKGGGDGK